MAAGIQQTRYHGIVTKTQVGIIKFVYLQF